MVKSSLFYIITAGAVASAIPISALAAPRILTPQEKVMIKHTMGESLSDPDSAEYIFGPDQTGTEMYCGVVNAKNQMGAYAGYFPFMVDVFRDSHGHITEALGGVIYNHQQDGVRGQVQAITLKGCRDHGFRVNY